MTDTGKVASWYDANVALEHDRLLNPRVEYSVTLRVILQCLDQLISQVEPQIDDGKQMRILDLGGGTGRYGKYTVILKIN